MADSDGLRLPSDVAFHPSEDHQLWITNQGDDSVVIVSRVGSPDRTVVRRRSLGSDHFLASPSGLAMGGSGTFATSQATDEVTQPTTPADFMGPSLWPADVTRFDAGHGSHLDMLHNSPNAVGIAWDHDNAFWVFDGYHESITYYDFGADHGPGGEDHSGAVITRYVEGELLHATGANAHIELDRATGLLYIADTANARVAVLDTRSGAPGRRIGPDYDGATMTAMESATLTTLVTGHGLDQPSGLALRDGVIYVTDRVRRMVHAFDLTGAQLDYLDLSDRAAELGGIEADVEGRLYVTTRSPASVLRIAPLP
ncbi:MAG: hypothetical protein J0L92_28385 [Deltaproteobacteria bacterium]|nr:hypothetical protein [Deltaproteobacteria bacterium]